MKISRILFVLFSLTVTSSSYGRVTIEECVEKAEANYPLIRKYDLLRMTNEIDLSEINKGWLPRIGISAQVTGQNIVPSFPEMLSDVLERMGQEVKGLGKIQYRAGIDVSQTIWDGGVSKARREITRNKSIMEQTALETELYALRQRVENIYFAILLIEQQIAQSESTYVLLTDNLKKVRSMKENGIAMQSDIDMIEAQALTLRQTISQAQNAAESYRKQLGLFVGEDIQHGELALPSDRMPAIMDSNRPELKLFDNKISVMRASNKLSDSSVMPKIGFFAQAYYGYPGIDYFKSMMSRDISFNIIAGIKISWNIDAFYTKKSNHNLSSLKISGIEAEKATFDFNTQLQTTSQTQAIEGLKTIIADDKRIVELRTNVRRAAESQLANGIIDMTALLSKITDENSAQIASKYHEIQLINEIYKLKYTLNR